MSALGFAERLTVRRLHNAVQRNLRRHQRRFESSSSSSSKSEPVSNTSRLTGNTGAQRTIPISGWQWADPILEPLRAYGRMQRRSPYTTQLSTGLVIYFVGDLSAQTLSSEVFTNREYDPLRSARAMFIGGLFSIPGYKFFLLLGRHFNYKSWILSIGTKILVSQTFFTPLFNSYFFTMQTLLTGGSLQDAKKRVIEAVPVSWKNSWKVWPAVTAFTFTFIPEQYRNVFTGCIAIGWQTYLSWINSKAEAKVLDSPVLLAKQHEGENGHQQQQQEQKEQQQQQRPKKKKKRRAQPAEDSEHKAEVAADH